MSITDFVKRILDHNEEKTLHVEAFEQRGKAHLLVEQSDKALEALREALKEAEEVIENKRNDAD